MDVICPSGFPVLGLRWRYRGQLYATFVLKATFTLEPLTSPLARTQEPMPRHASLHDVAMSLEGAPFKPRAEVVVVGSAYAPPHAPATRLIARVVVGDVDKTLVVHGERVRRSDGLVVDGPPFTRMPVAWNRSSGGAETWNPHGIVAHRLDPFGNEPLPNVVQLGEEEGGIPVGFGPVQPEWIPRTQYLGRGRIVRDGEIAILPDDLDGRFFQSALEDQQLSEPFATDTRIVLESFHPEHARLVTNLAPLHALATISSAQRRERKGLVADTLVIDTDSFQCALYFRGSVPVAPDERVHIQIDAASEVHGLPAGSGSEPPPAASYGPTTTTDASLRAPSVKVAAPAERASTVTFNFGDEPSFDGALEALPFAAPPSSAAAMSAAAMAASHATPPGVAIPVPLAPPLGPPLSPPLAPPLAPHVPPPLAPPIAPMAASGPVAMVAPSAPSPTLPFARKSSPSIPAIDGAKRSPSPIPPPPASSPAALPWGSTRPAGSTSADLAVRPERFRETQVSSGGVDVPRRTGPVDSALAASNDAAGIEASRARGAATVPREPRDHDKATSAAPSSEDPLDLLWFEAEIIGTIQHTAALRSFLAPKNRRAVREVDEERAAERRREDAVRLDVLRVMSHAPAAETGTLDRAWGGPATARPPIVVVRGDLVVRFDERDALRATVGIAAPFATLDKNLEGATELASAVADNEWSSATSIDGALKRLREALGRASRDLSPQVLDVAVQRALLERRRFRKVTLLGAEWLRTELTGTSRAVPLYLPAALKDELPLLDRFPIRAIAELRRRQDGAEQHDDALFVKALARRIGSAPKS